MSAFTGNHTSPVLLEDDDRTIKNDGWWPSFELKNTRETVRVVAGVTNARLLQAIRVAIADVNDELCAWKAKQLDLGHLQLEEVPADDVDEISVLVSYYRSAVYHTLDADLVEQYRDMDTTGAGDKRADALDERTMSARRNKRWAIAKILGYGLNKAKPTPKIIVGLI